MTKGKDDIEFLTRLRGDIDKYLFLGHAPSLGAPKDDPDVAKMEEALLNPKFQELRRKISESLPRARNIISSLNVNVIYVQYPPAPLSGRAPIIKQNLLEAVFKNMTWRRFPKTEILDVIDQGIGALRLKRNSDTGSNQKMDGKLPILDSSYLDAKLQNTIDEIINRSLPVSFVMIDIDYFKKFNDTYGHLIGDDVLKIVAILINGVVGDKGKVIRFGGEEIIVVLPNYNSQEAMSLGERIRNAVGNYNFKVNKDNIAKITVSIGISTTFAPIQYKDLINEADTALRMSKTKGRNQVNIYNKEHGDLSEDLIIIECIKDTTIKETAKKVLDALQNGKEDDFAYNVKFAFELAFRAWMKKYRSKIGFLPYDTIPELVQNNIINLNTAEFTKFEKLLPHITWFESGEHGTVWRKTYGFTLDKENMKFCLSFCLKAILEFKREVDI